MVCPTKARFFGDLGDPNSAVSELVAARGGKDLMPELGYRPVNKYLPPRRNRKAPDFAAAEAEPHPVTGTSGLLALGRPAAVAIGGLVNRPGPADISEIAEFANCIL